MNNTLTAKEWLEKEGIYNSNDLGLADQIENGINPQRFDLDSVMEKYANYKNRILEAKILEFRKELEVICDSLNDDWNVYISNIYLDQYDKHFNIEKVAQ